MYGDAPLPADRVTALLRDVWGLPTGNLRYARIGYGGYHWLASAGARRIFVTADPALHSQRTLAGYALARRLADDGLDLVRAPLLTRGGRVAHPIDDWHLSAWPWLEGRAALDGRHTSDADVEATACSLRRLHDHPAGPPVDGLQEDWAIEGEERFARCVERPDRNTGPYTREVRALLERSAAPLRTARARYDELTASRPPTQDWVLTHGEPHAANVVHTASGAVLIDWDTARWAPRERDLWILSSYATWQRGYGDTPLDEALLDAYRLQWRLTEIALFTADLLEATSPTPDRDVALRELRAYTDDLGLLSRA